LFLSRIGAFFLRNRITREQGRGGTNGKGRDEDFRQDIWAGEGSWRIGHRILGSLIIALGFVNISLGVFLAVLPLPVWIIWYIYLGFLVLIVLGLEIVSLFRRGGASGGTGKGKSAKFSGKHKN
jgi:hypothetical protein